MKLPESQINFDQYSEGLQSYNIKVSWYYTWDSDGGNSPRIITQVNVLSGLIDNLIRPLTNKGANFKTKQAAVHGAELTI